MFGALGTKQPLHGISIGIDIPRTGFITPYGQLSAFIPKTYFEENVGSGQPKPGVNLPAIDMVNLETRVSTFSLELGTMYYIGGAYDYGFSAMFHNSFRALLIPTRHTFPNFTPETHDFWAINPSRNFDNIPSFVLNVSGGVGLKYSFEWGSVYALAGIEVPLIPSGNVPYFYTPSGGLSFVNYSTRIGMRKELDFSKNTERKQIRENNRRERQKM